LQSAEGSEEEKRKKLKRRCRKKGVFFEKSQIAISRGTRGRAKKEAKEKM
jgi:hypothetical protein